MKIEQVINYGSLFPQQEKKDHWDFLFFYYHLSFFLSFFPAGGTTCRSQSEQPFSKKTSKYTSFSPSLDQLILALTYSILLSIFFIFFYSASTKDHKPDGVLGAAPVQFSIFVQDDVHLKVAVIVMGGEVVCHDPPGDPETTQDCGEGEVESYRHLSCDLLKNALSCSHRC